MSLKSATPELTLEPVEPASPSVYAYPAFPRHNFQVTGYFEKDKLRLSLALDLPLQHFPYSWTPSLVQYLLRVTRNIKYEEIVL